MSFACEAWKVIATGGWWSAQEVAKRVPLDVDLRDAYANLFSMSVRHKSLIRRRRATGHEYAVSPECVPPRGLTVAEIVSAATGQGERPSHAQA